MNYIYTMEKLITLAKFELPQESYIIKSKMESEGIYVYLKDELTVQSDNFVSNAIGGVKLQVLEKDVEKSTEILKFFDVIISKPLPPENFVLVFDKTTRKIPFIGRFSLENRGVIIIISLLVLLVFLSVIFS